MLNLSATSYATNKVVKSAGTAGLVPYLAHADRAGAEPGAGRRRLPLRQARRDAVALLPDRSSPSSPARRRAGCTGRRSGARSPRRVRGRRRCRARPDRRPTVDGGSHRHPERRPAFHFRNRFGRPHPEPGGACAGHELSCAMDRLRADPRAAIPLLGTAFAGKLLGCAGLFMVLSGPGDPPRRWRRRCSSTR